MERFDKFQYLMAFCKSITSNGEQECTKKITSYFTFGPGAPLSPLAPSFPSKPCGKGKPDLWTVFKYVVSYDYCKSEKNWKCLWKTVKYFTCSYRIGVANTDLIF